MQTSRPEHRGRAKRFLVAALLVTFVHAVSATTYMSVEHDWRAFPNGDQYLANIGGSAQLVSELSVLRQKHLTAVGNLLQAIAVNQVADYLDRGFSCPN